MLSLILLLLAGTAMAQTPTMNVQQTVSAYAENIDPNHAGKERAYELVVENQAPSTASEYNLITFVLNGFVSTNDIYGISLDDIFANWNWSWVQADGKYNLVLHSGTPLIADGNATGIIRFYTPHAAQQTNAATATAGGTSGNPNIPFTPVGVVLPAAAPVAPGLGAEWTAGHGLSLTATNLALGYGYTVESSTNLLTWTSVGTFWATNASQPLPVPPPTNAPAEFYRLTCP